jgi:hypothetical protein
VRGGDESFSHLAISWPHPRTKVRFLKQLPREAGRRGRRKSSAARAFWRSGDPRFQHRHGKVGLARAGRSDAEDTIVSVHGLHVTGLHRRARFDLFLAGANLYASALKKVCGILKMYL